MTEDASTRAAPGAAASPGTTNRPLAIALVMVITMNAFEAMAVVTAMPAVADDLDGDALYGAAFSAYMLANLVSLVFTGEQADRRGPVRPFVFGVVLFAAGLVVAGVAPTMLLVVVGRALQGAGAGALTSVAYVAATRAFPSEQQPRLFALLAAAWVVPSLVAPALAGLVTEEASWRWVFIGLLPLVPLLVVLALPALRRLPPPPPEARARPLERLPLALLLAAGSALLVAGLQAADWWVAVPAVVVGAVLALPALGRLLPPGTARGAPGLAAAVAARLCVNIAFFGTDTFVPLAANRLHGVGTLAAGLVITGASLTWSAGAQISAHQSRRRPPGWVVRAGFATIAIGILGTIPVVWASTPLPLVFLGWSVAGLGMGLVFNTTSVTAMGSAPAGREGLVSSQLQVADTLGFALTGGVGGAIVAMADRGAVSLSTGLLIQFALAFGAALIGWVVGGRVRPAGASLKPAAAARA